MKVNFLFLLLCILAVSSCRRSDNKKDCAGIICDYSGMDFRFRLVDAAGKNLVYGPDARIQVENISLSYNDIKFELKSSPDSAKASAYISTSVQQVLSVMQMRPDTKEFTVPVVMKINTAGGESSYLLTIKYGLNCCGYSLLGLYMDKAGTFYKPVNDSISPYLINIPIGL